MSIELKFTKSDCDTPWGFRLTGGAEFDVPITVIKVAEESIADLGGLHTGDVLVRINDTPTLGLTHGQTHDLLVAAGDCLILAVRREDYEDDAQREPNQQHREADEEVAEILKRDEEDTVAEKKVHFEEGVQTIPSEVQIACKIQDQVASASPNTERKWSTFLQKPKNAKPVAKMTNDNIIPKGAPYRVVIKKQKRRTPEERAQAKQQQLIAQELEIEETVEEKSECSTLNEHQSMASETEIEVRMETTEEEIIVTADTDNEEMDEDSLMFSTTSDNDNDHHSDITSNAMADKKKTLEAKLEEVHRQLLALSQLPSTIQLTLDAVTKELTNIVNASMDLNEQQDGEEDRKETGAEEECGNDDDNLSETNTAAENEITPEGEDNSEACEFPEPQNENNGEVHSDAEEISEAILAVQEDEDSDAGLTEEEKEAKLQERQRQDKLEKKDIVKERRPSQPLKPIERPIILPGGRKWSQPDDACPAVKNPKMSDEKIANTLETFSEVIIGKTKGLTIGTKFGPGAIKISQSTEGMIYYDAYIPNIWCDFVGRVVCFQSVNSRESNCFLVPSRAIATKKINFLKYQPPPKNLEHLQRSEVYKLVHHSEPPVRGISSRACKILAEQDYYEQTKEVQ